ncbi:MAG: hypothetical protein O2958_10470 [Gemmatimonadetes bacterium]|nr:hypothetical protein [Gemmatimonadota bacterium]MDA1103463.1 hypothetical protein [Gemmatimonadota bacterium]
MCSIIALLWYDAAPNTRTRLGALLDEDPLGTDADSANLPYYVRPNLNKEYA